MLEKHKKFAAYWESIGSPKLEIMTVDGWLDAPFDLPSWGGDIDYRIKDDPHWELRREWIDSDFTLPIEYEAENNQWRSTEDEPTWSDDTQYRKAQTNEDKTMPEFKIGDKVKIVKKVTAHPQGKAFIWNDVMDKTIGNTESISELGQHSEIKLDNGWWYLPESLELLPNENTMTEQNPRAALIAEYCEDWKVTSTPWIGWQWMGVAEKWTDCNCHPEWVHNIKYRRKPKTIKINGFDVPMPIHVKPEIGCDFYVACTGSKDYCRGYEWNGDNVQCKLLERNICHLDAESAIIHAKALLSFTSKGE